MAGFNHAIKILIPLPSRADDEYRPELRNGRFFAYRMVH